MTWYGRVLAMVAAGVLSSPAVAGAAATPTPPALLALVGHWSCTDANGATQQRSYVVSAEDDGAVVGRMTNASQKSETPAFERFAPDPTDGVRAQIPEGSGTGTLGPDGTLDITGTAPSGARTFDVRYAVNGDTLERTVVANPATISEHCTRIAPDAAPPVTPCTQRETPTKVLKVEGDPVTPFAARQAGVHGIVTVIVELDDQSEVVGERVYASPSPLLDDDALKIALHAHYRTETAACRAVPSAYLFTVGYS